MYAVIRTGGKQYRVSPGDVIRLETLPAESGTIEFTDVLAVSSDEGPIDAPPPEARVIGTILEQGRGDKILVFHYKRKKQYKKLRGHRQPYTAVRITEIACNGERFTEPNRASGESSAPAASPGKSSEGKGGGKTSRGKRQSKAGAKKASGNTETS